MKTSVKSIVGTVPKETGGLRIDIANKKNNIEPCIVNIDGKDYFVGNYAKKYSRNPISNLSGEHFTSANMLLPLTYAALGDMCSGERISAMVSLPISTMLNKKASEETTEALRSLLLGEHRFTLDGKNRSFAIDLVNFTGQGVAALYSSIYDINGRVMMNSALMREKLGIIDIGFGTLDLFTLNALDIDAAGTSGCNLGVHFPMEELQARVRAKYDIELTQDQALECINGQRKAFYYEGEQVPMQELLDSVYDIWITEIEQMLQRHIRNGKEYARLYFCGGGVSYISNRLKQRFPHGVVLSNPIYANAIGCYRVAAAKKLPNPVGIDPGFYAYKVVRNA